MTNQIYTTGYGNRTPAEIMRLVETLDAVLVDIRFSPYGRPGFKGFELRQRLTSRYLHIKALGNAEYKSGGMRIADYEAGRSVLASLERPALLLCACSSPIGCHRTVVGAMLLRDGFAVSEIEAPRITRENPEPTSHKHPQQPSLWG